ncbi:MAG: terminase small subunit [Gammaproteobacteria bacterium]|uniref:Terminase small subunit n=1 Tax=Pseudomonas mandelii TaxID=75612 RepID=A0AB36CQW7_9PSED|nr:terminase small subunit [Pseudomonas mandelii]MBU0522705.1 terminase small subunit [Gammaproteobacteria bacterium]MBU0821876.1 terminase small subunit [Gammaproteobacteria bacterium]MBU0843989.1 terminase small subunit [Gammaproteobacteria bacterium]MBU1842240.1 terminase small subunit [Gammaproteobacteria bacterium]NMZ78412.1 terminase small subunit [Pseudomonas mandelii]
MALTAKQQAFVIEYLVDLNATQAAIRAGYSKRGAKDQAWQLMQRPDITEAIAKAIEARNKRTQVDADYVLNRLTEIDQMDLLDILEDDMSIKPLSKWPKVWRQSLSGFDIAEMFEGVGKDRDLVGLMKKIKWPDKVKNLELLGKHVNVNAFRDQVAHSGSINLTNMTDDELDAHIARLANGQGK